MIISLYPYLLRIIAKCVDMVLVLLFFLSLCIFVYFYSPQSLGIQGIRRKMM